MLGVDLLGTIYGIRTFLPLLREHAPDGHIVNTSSIAGLDSHFLTAAPYVAAKHAVVGISECLRAELDLAGSPVGVTVVCPAQVATRLSEAERNRPGAPHRRTDSPRTLLENRSTSLQKEVQQLTDVAALVLEAIEADRLHLLPTPGSHSGPVARVARLLDSIARDVSR